MELLVIILNKTECLDELLKKLAESNIKGATILDSRGLAQTLIENDEFRFVASLRKLLDPCHRENKTIFMVIEKEKISTVSKIVNEVTGGLEKPDSGVIFTIPVNYSEGFTV